MTILSAITKSTNLEIDQELNTLIIKNLENLFIQVCNINVSELTSCNQDYFVFDIILDHEIIYKFVYGEVRITSYNNKLNVCVFFNYDIKPMIPLGAKWVRISVNDNMIYNSAIFTSDFTLVGIKPLHYNRTTADLSIIRFIDNTFKATISIGYSVYDSSGDVVNRIDFQPSDIPALFFEINNDFYTPLIKIFNTCTNSPNIFYDIFNEYPSITDLTTDSSYFKTFLLHYYSQYMTEKNMLDSNVILLDMQEI